MHRLKKKKKCVTFRPSEKVSPSQYQFTYAYVLGYTVVRLSFGLAWLDWFEERNHGQFRAIAEEEEVHRPELHEGHHVGGPHLMRRLPTV